MRILFDQGTPVPLRSRLRVQAVVTAYEKGWATLRNGELLDAAEAEGFKVFVTTDQNLRYQQNLSTRKLAVVVLSTTSWSRIKRQAALVESTVNGAIAEQVSFVQVP
ncbi:MULTISPECIES: hypothetical protein [Cyanophyceae]|uniref:hypothetical protein n=1 Tax=Cyanophyceae TaxID=3028117 RepID=UPI0016845B1E|nr:MULTISPECIES: hypothetical protein [Cyanophyceae]MBD1914843.1 hypothetical protein [Phormidium sp. FACHB-77]MBD2029961.1 hypothetical protein [Phormidium sp. FACHB-322]MBD2049271.1 hypothetical protein [Leptolyngbya sp. FACHB-60]